MTSPSADAFASPRASIVVLGWRLADHLDACLRSLSACLYCAVTPAEVIVVLNGATPDVADIAAAHPWVRVVHSSVNLGFAGGCNLGRSVARGEYLVLLNDDAMVEPGWLDALVATADEDAQVGAVGSRILYPEGQLQEAGSVLWANGSTACIGDGDDGESHSWAWARRVTYCSACSLLVRATAWDRVGGLDEAFFPGYFEDVDFCLALAEAGWRIVYQAGSVVRHHRSMSLGDDERRLAFQSGRSRLSEKWPTSLSARRSPRGIDRANLSVAARVDERATLRVLVIDDRLPAQGVGSGFGRMFTAVRAMKDARCDVAVKATDILGSDPIKLEQRGVEVVYEAMEVFLSRVDVAIDVVVISRPNNGRAWLQVVREALPWAAIVYDAEALYHRRMQAQSRLTGDVGMLAEAEEMAATEVALVREADASVFISDHERNHIVERLATSTGLDDGRREQGGSCFVVEPHAETPIIDDGPSFDERFRMIFVASWLSGGASPNGDGLRWFVSEVLPLVRAALPWVTLTVTGANPPVELLELQREGVEFSGFVDDLPGLMDTARVAIAPIRYGAGVKLKVLDAIGRRVPVIATTIGAEGLPQWATSGVTVSDDADVQAAALVEILACEKAWSAKRPSPPPRRGPSAFGWPDVLWEALTRRAATKGISGPMTTAHSVEGSPARGEVRAGPTPQS